MSPPKKQCDDLDQMLADGASGAHFFNTLVECLADDVRRFAMARCGDSRGDVEDISQDALLAARRYLEGFRGEASLRTWMYRLVLSACSRHRRGRKNDPNLHRVLDDEPEDPTLPEAADPEVSLLMRERLGALEEALKTLRPEDRDMLAAVEWDGQSLAEVAARYNLTVSAVKSRMFRIRRQLREQLMTHFGEGADPAPPE